tara:strand:+ start:6853 stop:7005 length:153 start_codon:yes stop_codon:yes gene_type:complete
MEFFIQNWGELLLAVMAFIKVITRLTPGVKDDAVFNYLDKLIDAIVPNNE